MSGLRGWAEPPKQEKAKKDLRGIRGVVFSGVSNSNRNQTMKLNQLSIGTVFFFAGQTATAFRLTKTGVTNMVTKNRMTFKRFPNITDMEVQAA